MSRSNDVGAPCLNETWGSSSMSGWLFDAVDTPGFWNKKPGVLAGNSRAVFSFMGHDRPLHDQWLGAVCGFRQWSETSLFDERRLLPVVPSAEEVCRRNRIGPNQSRTDDRTLRDKR